MDEKGMSRREKREARQRRARVRRLQKMAMLGALALIVLVAGGFVLRAALLRKDVAAASPNGASVALAETPAPSPTAEPAATATPVPTPTPEPTLKPTPIPVEKSVLITATGDCTIGGNARYDAEGFKRFKSYYDQFGSDYFLANFRDIFLSDDLTIINFEGTIPGEGDKIKNSGYNFAALPEYTQILTGSGVDLCTLANNHSLDFGSSGLVSTAKTLEAAGVGVCGYTNYWYQEINGVNVCACGFLLADESPDDYIRQVAQLASTCDLLIVNMHWGVEERNQASGGQRACGKAMIDAGADLVIGNHSHVLGDIEKYKGKYIIYSLGNFCFGGNKNPKDKDCLVFQQKLILNDQGEIEDGGIRLIPASISGQTNTNDYQPRILTGDEANNVIARVRKYSQNLSAKSILWLPAAAVAQAEESGNPAALPMEADSTAAPET